MIKATEPEEVNLHEVNLDALSEIKKIALNIPLNEKLYALSLYQPCGGNDENIIVIIYLLLVNKRIYIIY